MTIVAMSMALLAVAPPVPVPPPPIAISFLSVDDATDGRIVAHVALLNARDGLARRALDRFDATLHVPGRDIPVVMTREGPVATIPANGYLQADYVVQRPEGVAGRAVLSIPSGRDGYAFALRGVTEGGQQAARASAATGTTAAPERQARETASRFSGSPPPRTGNDLLGNLSTYNPIYAVMGAGTDTNARLELSFKYQLLGHPGDGHWYSGFHLAYTQRMFWDTSADSAPFRDVNYQPEFLYFYTLPKNRHGDQWSVHGGFLHQSNGRGGAASRSYNILYVQPQLDFPIGGWTASVGPRVQAYVLPRSDNPDIARYRGHQALAFSIGRSGGLKLSTWSRLNFGSGKGAFDADLSYPLTGIWHDLPLYLVVQGFTGYGEDLLDYDRKQTRLRVGIGIVR